MDVGLPLRSVSPGVDGDVLGVLLRTHAPLTGNKVSQMAGRSYAQVRHVLHRLVDDGLVSAERHGNAVSYTFNREHVTAAGLEELTRLHDEVEGRIRDFVSMWSLPARSAAVFGSFARRDGSADSDIDLLLVRSAGVALDNEVWSAQRHAPAAAIERWTGNPARIVDMSPAELTAAASRDEPLIGSLRDEVKVVAGEDLAWALLAATSSGAL